MEPHPDKAIIDRLGGPAEVARKLNLPLPGGCARVYNWTTRGIPDSVRLHNLELFGAPPAGRPRKKIAGNASKGHGRRGSRNTRVLKTPRVKGARRG